MDKKIETMLQVGEFKKLLEAQSAELREKYGMKKAELEILYYLSHCGSHNTSSDIHQHLLMNRGHISQAVSLLCEKNYIIAIPDQQDRRYVHYEIAESASELISELTRRREEINKQI
ncbi:MAG: MarR family winged helix-turn-helix transcriptional regulator, partial [bacterium]|nr:MarR family winged helix-turn-helix transcriptional regulator [bacterium]